MFHLLKSSSNKATFDFAVRGTWRDIHCALRPVFPWWWRRLITVFNKAYHMCQYAQCAKVILGTMYEASSIDASCLSL